MIKLHICIDGPKVVGTKQTKKALEEGDVSQLYIAKDADKLRIQDVLRLAETKRVPVLYVESMDELGKACDVKVRTATAALITN